MPQKRDCEVELCWCALVFYRLKVCFWVRLCFSERERFPLFVFNLHIKKSECKVKSKKISLFGLRWKSVDRKSAKEADYSDLNQSGTEETVLVSISEMMERFNQNEKLPKHLKKEIGQKSTQKLYKIYIYIHIYNIFSHKI